MNVGLGVWCVRTRCPSLTRCPADPIACSFLNPGLCRSPSLPATREHQWWGSALSPLRLSTDQRHASQVPVRRTKMPAIEAVCMLRIGGEKRHRRVWPLVLTNIILLLLLPTRFPLPAVPDSDARCRSSLIKTVATSNPIGRLAQAGPLPLPQASKQAEPRPGQGC